MFLGFILINLESSMKLGMILLFLMLYFIFLKVYGRQLIPSYPEDDRESSQGYEWRGEENGEHSFFLFLSAMVPGF